MTVDAVMAWFRKARRANGASFEEIREPFPAADRVIVTADFRHRVIYVKALLTHKEYDRGEWKKWP